MNEFLIGVEKHKDLADLGLKAIGLAGTLAAALVVSIKYLAEKRAARQAQELDLRRDAYFNFFAAIPLQLAAVANFFRPNRDPLVMPQEHQLALHKLHLLANRESLKIIIERNALFHKSVMSLAEIKATALNHQELRDHLLNDILVAETKHRNGSGTGHQVAATREEFEQLEPLRIRAWESFIAKYQQLLEDLSRNYIELLPHARAEIGLAENIAETVATLKNDREIALGEFTGQMPTIRKRFNLEP